MHISQQFLLMLFFGPSILAIAGELIVRGCRMALEDSALDALRLARGEKK